MSGSMPGFLAEAALYPHSRLYRGRAGGAAPAGAPKVASQLARRFGAAGPAGQLLARGGLGFACGGLACTCSGDADCNDMFSTGVCGDIAQCIDDGCWCLRL